jgi:hypothetical protein
MLQAAIDTTGKVDWDALIPEEEWDLYKLAIDNLRERGVRFALGGGLAFSEYAIRARNTKDLDLYIYPPDKDAAIGAVLAAGFDDYHEQQPYDRTWIFRACKRPVIVDLIWTTPNHRMDVDHRWLVRGRDVNIRGARLKLLPPEELIWAKLYVMQRDRCDWPDLLNVLHATGPLLDWRHLIDRVGKDAPLLGGLLSAYRWLCPEQSRALPTWVWERVGLRAWPEATDETCEDRKLLLDSRDWFGHKETLEQQQ